MSKYENTVVRALREAWYIEEIQQLIHMEATTIQRIAKRHNLIARHAPRSPNYMRHKAIATALVTMGRFDAARKFKIVPTVVDHSFVIFTRLDKERRQLPTERSESLRLSGSAR